MAKIKINFSEKSVAEKIATATNIIIRMSANSMFSPYENEINDAAEAVDLLSEAYLFALSGENVSQRLMSRREKDLTEQMSLLAFYVQILSKGKEDVIRLAGFDVIEYVIADDERPALQKQLAEMGVMRVQ